MRNGIKLFCIVGALVILTIGNSQATERKKQANVLLILVDDLKPTLGTYGDKVVHSPNIDKLASKGMRFDNAYCNQAVCSASRYNLMLGTRSTTSGILGFGTNFREVYPNATTLPQYFKDAGYHTESIGKVFHIGHGNTDDKSSWSVPSHKEKVIEYILPESTNRKLTREEAYFENTRMYIQDFPKNNDLPRGAAWEAPDVLDDAYADGRVAKHTINRLRDLKANLNEPFFMAVGFARPHLPFCVPKKYWNLYDENRLPMPEFEGKPKDAPDCAMKTGGEITQFFPIPKSQKEIYADNLKRKLIHGYYASISYMDAQLGKVIDELERLELSDNTVIVLWGDHGWHLGDHGIWTKHTNFEQANKIPLIIVAPEVTRKQSESNQMVETVDIFPTLVSLAGLAKPNVQQPIDGTDLTPVLADGKQRVKNHAYHAYIRHGYIGEAIRTERFRMVRWSPINNTEKDVLYELYDYETDPNEMFNIARQNSKKVNELEKLLNSHPKAKTKPE